MCGADEKVIRLFEPTAIFVNYINYMTKFSFHLFYPKEADELQYLVKNQDNIIEYKTETEGGGQVYKFIL